MKKMTFFIGIVMLFAIYSNMNAQNWLLNGNWLAGPERLGSTNNMPVIMINNNVESMRLDQNGSVGIGMLANTYTTTPYTLFHVQKGSVLFDANILGNSSAPSGLAYDLTPARGTGVRLMWIPGKYGAFRAGHAHNNYWDNDSIGQTSFAVGYATRATGEYSVAMGAKTRAEGNASMAVNEGSESIGYASFASGSRTQAEGPISFAANYLTNAEGYASFATGIETTAHDSATFAQGKGSYANRRWGSAFGYWTISDGDAAFAANYQTRALNRGAFSTGLYTEAIGEGSFSGGEGSRAVGRNAVAFGFATRANGDYSFTAGKTTYANGISSFAVGDSSTADGEYCFVTGFHNYANETAAMATGYQTQAPVKYAASFNYMTKAIAPTAAAFNFKTEASGEGSFAAGNGTVASGDYAATFNEGSTASGNGSFAINYGNTASGVGSFASGKGTVASNELTATFGSETRASGVNAFAAGRTTTASGENSMAVNYDNTASGPASFAAGKGTLARGDMAAAFGYTSSAVGHMSFAINTANLAEGRNSFVGGLESSTRGDVTFAFGEAARADGPNSFALGRNVASNGYQGSFILGDYSGVAITNTANNQFTARYSGGLGGLGNAAYNFFTNSTATLGVYLNANTSGIHWSSDRELKENFETINEKELLEKLDQLEVTTWTYKNTPSNIRYMGPMAQDFHSTFGLGGDDYTGVNSINITGVNMAGVKALIKENKEQAAQITTLQEKVNNLESRLTAIENELGMKTFNSVEDNSAVSNIILKQNSPNPYSDQTNIAYFIPSELEGNVELIITDLNGSNIINTYTLNKGSEDYITFNSKNINSGVYLYAISLNGEIVVSKKMLVNK